MILYHGTSAEKAKQILAKGFTPNNRKMANWKVKSKNGYVYLSLAYAPFYAHYTTMEAKQKLAAIVKVEVDKSDLLPEDDFIMYLAKKNVYTQKDIDKVDLKAYKHLANYSLQYLGNACALYNKVKVLGVQEFDCSKMILVCDPSISPINYKFKGDYYKQLTEIIYEGKDFLQWSREYNRKEQEQLFKSLDLVLDTPKSEAVHHPEFGTKLSEFVSEVKGEKC